MANLGQSFNVNDAPENSYKPLPAGKYTAMITESEVKNSKSGNNYLNLQLEILTKEYAGRVVFDILNLWHSKPEVANIAKATLGDIQKATGVSDVQDSSQLHGKPIIVKLAIKPETAEFDASNVVKGYYPIKADDTITVSDDGGKPWENEGIF